jgi:hypothetical protein
VPILTSRSRLSPYSVRLDKFLGRGFDKFSIISSALFAVISLFYVFSLGAYLKVIVYYFLLRFSYIKTSNEYLFSRNFDGIMISSLTVLWLVLSLEGKARKISVASAFGLFFLVAVVLQSPELMTFVELSTLPVIVLIILYSNVKRRRRPEKTPRLVSLSLSLSSNYLIILATILGLFSVSISLSVILGLQSFSVEKIFQTKQIPVDNYGYEIFIFFSALSPLLLIITFFCFPIKLFLNAILQRIPKFAMRGWLFLYSQKLEASLGIYTKRTRIIYLSLFVLLSISLAIIPQLPTVNKDNQQIGSDSLTYVEWISSLKQEKTLLNFLLATLQIQNGDRPLSLVVIYLFTSIIDAPPLDIIEYLPILLGPALVLVVYLLTREVTHNETTSLFAASLTGLGNFQVSLGIYAGFYANWIALLVGFLSIIFFFRFLRSPRKRSLVTFFVLLVVMLFTHAYTWSVFSLAIGIFTIAILLLKQIPKKTGLLLLIAVISSVVIDLARTFVLSPYGSQGGIELTLSLAQTQVAVKELGLIWETLVDAVQHHFGGIFSNFIVLGLVIYWFIRSELRTDFNLFLVVFLMIGIPPLFLGDWVLQSRVFYNIPFQIPAAIALTFLLKQKNASRIIVPVYIWLFAVSIWTVSNFYEVSPS